MRNRKKNPFQNVVLIILCLILCVALGIFLMWNQREEKRNIQELKRQALEETASVGDTGGETGEPGNGGADASQQNPGQGENTGAAQENGDASGNPGGTSTDPQEITGISLRGDCFVEEKVQDKKGYAAQFQELMQKEGKNLAVWDYTMSEAGSMTQLRLAGVPTTELDAYVAKHKEAAGETDISIFETKIRDLSEEELVREDQQGIPVICMGYYGGWNGDLEELCQQQQRMLDTYSQKEKYIILGVYPSGYSNKEAYDQMMTQKWGEHYLAAQEKIESPVLSDEGQKEIAEAIYEKMTELEYLS